MIACLSPVANCFKNSCTNLWGFLESVVYTTCCGLNREPYKRLRDITTVCAQALKERKDHEQQHCEIVKWQMGQCSVFCCSILNGGTHDHSSDELRFLNSHLRQLMPHSHYARWLKEQMREKKKSLPRLIFFAEQPYDSDCSLCKLGKEEAINEKKLIGESRRAIVRLAFREEGADKV